MNNLIIKNAEDSVLSGLGLSNNTILNYFNSHIDPENKTSSVLSMLVPGAIFSLLVGSSPIIATVLSFAAAYYHMDIKKILDPVFNSVKSDITKGKPITPGHIDQYVDSAISTVSSGGAEEEFAVEASDIRKFKLALIAYANDNSEFQFSKYALKSRIPTQGVTRLIIRKLISWPIKVILFSAGFLVLADVAKKYMGKPNALDGTQQKGKPVSTRSRDEGANRNPIIIPQQTKFKLNPNYNNKYYDVNWKFEGLQASRPVIEELLVNFAKEVYLGLDGLENIIRSTGGFRRAVDNIEKANENNMGYNLIIMPTDIYSNKKQIVDTFIDDVAKNSA